MAGNTPTASNSTGIAQRGTTISFRLNEAGSTARVALVANSDGLINVAVHTPRGMNDFEAHCLTQLLESLSAVTRLARDMRVSYPTDTPGGAM